MRLPLVIARLPVAFTRPPLAASLLHPAAAHRRSAGSAGDRLAATAVGHQTVATGVQATALGKSATASGDGSIAIGGQATPTGSMTARNATASSAGSVAVGAGAIATNGTNATSLGTAVAVGNLAEATDEDAVAVGDRALASGFHATAVGGESVASGRGAQAFGWQSRATGNLSLAAGHQATAAGTQATAVGKNASASGANSTAIGFRRDGNRRQSGRPRRRRQLGPGWRHCRQHCAQQASSVGVATVDANGVLGRNTTLLPQVAALQTTVAAQGTSITALQAAQTTQAGQITALQGQTATLFDLNDINRRGIRKANEGVAMALAMDSPAVPSGANYAVSGGLGYFEDRVAATPPSRRESARCRRSPPASVSASTAGKLALALASRSRGKHFA
jgi:autotransporter adhesin